MPPFQFAMKCRKIFAYPHLFIFNHIFLTTCKTNCKPLLKWQPEFMMVNWYRYCRYEFTPHSSARQLDINSTGVFQAVITCLFKKWESSLRSQAKKPGSLEFAEPDYNRNNRQTRPNISGGGPMIRFTSFGSMYTGWRLLLPVPGKNSERSVDKVEQ